MQISSVIMDNINRKKSQSHCHLRRMSCIRLPQKMYDWVTVASRDVKSRNTEIDVGLIYSEDNKGKCN